MSLAVAFGYPVAFFTTILLVLALRPIAARHGLIDRPGGRKSHEGFVPVVGGLAIFAGLVGALILSGAPVALLTIAAIAALLVFVGFFDDIRDLSPAEKLSIQVLAVALMIAVGGVKIDSLGQLTSQPVVLGGVISVTFTIFAAVGLINAVNMIDGMDGLAGGVAAVALSFFAFAAFAAGAPADGQLALLTLSSVLGFLPFNVRIGRRGARVFMGDAGSLLLGFVLAWLAISLSQSPHKAITPIAAVWVMGVPLLDALTVMLQRILSGKSPLCGDRGHLHHILLDCGLSANQTLLVILALGIVFGGIGVASAHVGWSEKVMLVAALIIFVAYFSATLFVKRRERGVRRVGVAFADMLDETEQRL